MRLALRAEMIAGGRNAGFRLVLAAYAAFSFLDWFTTVSALPRRGREANPVAASLYLQYGSVGLFLFKAMVVAVISAVLLLIPRRVMSQRVAIWLATAFVLVTGLAVIDNAHALTALWHAPYDVPLAPGARVL
jgi:Domain of unknown function (DUF5658)